ncbi:facilitated trehalose transporter Tret1-like [Homalodisca vitripennis]|uniref:facilitated trehalose transporter Tret1-like n=1 Tax=Homalodisca vitripennis TaxID=197043 RepID=UPI001EEB76AF|nr:facilitated trehalose transporter Tret1-like [Homalodisca vitripennis]
MGTTWSWLSPMQPLLTSENPPVGTEPMTEHTIAWLGSLSFAGSIIGALFWDIAADRLGRKMTLFLVAVPFIISWIMILVAQNVTWLLVARLIAGLGNNGATVVVPFFISEISQDDLRGFFGSFFMIFSSAGMLFSNVVGYYLKYEGLAISGMLIPIVFVLIFASIPETPVCLWQNKRYNKAKQTLLWYRGGDVTVTETELLKYSAFTQTSQSKRPPLKALIATKGNTKALLIASASYMAFQASGILPIAAYSVSIFEICGTSINAFQSAIIIASVQLVFGCVGSPLVDRLGRKVLLGGTLLVSSACLAILGGYLYFVADRSVNPVLEWIPILSLSIHVIAFAVGIGPVPFVITSEIFPLEIKGLALAKLQFLNCMFTFGFVKVFPDMIRYLGPYGCFWVFSTLCVLTSAFFILYFPETKGKSQDEILRLLNGCDKENETEKLYAGYIPIKLASTERNNL